MELGDFNYWFDAWLFGFSRIRVWLVIFLGLLPILFICWFKLMKKENKSPALFKSAVFVLFLCVLITPLCFDFQKEVAFRKACSEEAGLFVYEQINLGEEYWGDIGVVNRMPIDSHYILRDYAVKLRSELFDENYKFEYGPFESGIKKGWSNSLLSINGDKTYIDVRTFYGGPTGFLSQRNRQCDDLNDEFTSLPTTPVKLVEYFYKTSMIQGDRK